MHIIYIVIMDVECGNRNGIKALASPRRVQKRVQMSGSESERERKREKIQQQQQHIER